MKTDSPTFERSREHRTHSKRKNERESAEELKNDAPCIRKARRPASVTQSLESSADSAKTVTIKARCQDYPKYIKFFSDNIIVRVLVAAFTFQAAILWIAFALNFIVQLLFLRFDDHIVFIIACFATIPGIILFSAHYFWFVMQVTAHCISQIPIQNKLTKTSDVSSSAKKNISNELLLWIHDQDRQYVIRLYRAIVIVMACLYVVVLGIKNGYANEALIVPAGQVPLVIMWIMHALHILAFLWFVFNASKNCCTQRHNIGDEDVPNLQTDDNKSLVVKNTRLRCSNFLGQLTLQTIIPILLQLLATLLLLAPVPWISGVFGFLCIIWLFNRGIICSLFSRTSTQKDGENDYSCFTVCFSSCSNVKDNDHQKIFQYFQRFKVVFVFFLVVLTTPLTYLCMLDKDISGGTKGFVLLIVILMWVIEVFLLLPDNCKYDSNKMNHWQAILMNLLITIGSLLSVISVISLMALKRPPIHLIIGCLIPPLLYHVLMFFYCLRHILRDYKVTAINKNSIVKFLEAHRQVSRWPRAFMGMSLTLLILLYGGIVLTGSLYYDLLTINNPQNRTSIHGSFLLPSDIQEYNYSTAARMQICEWRKANLNIQDLILFSMLAYKPTDAVEIELNALYDGDFKVQIDKSLSHYELKGYYNSTYFTAVTQDAVIVAIRGTTTGYEALIDADIWIESLIYQVISWLFPWSKFFPESLTSRIIRHMSMLERVAQGGQENRFYVEQMIKNLQEIEKVYGKKRTFIVVGHSLGGGLTKLAGITLNTTDTLVSVSGPGITYAHAKIDRTLAIDTQLINQRVVNIFYDRDIVPWVDKQEGLMQVMTCPRDHSFVHCHSVNRLFCDVVKQCGNPRQFRVREDLCTLLF